MDRGLPRRRWLRFVLGDYWKSRKISRNNLWPHSLLCLFNSYHLLLDLSQDCSRIPYQELFLQVDLVDHVDKPPDSLRVSWPFMASLFRRQARLQFYLRHVAVVRNLSFWSLTLGDSVDPLRGELFHIYCRGWTGQDHHLDWRLSLLRLYSPRLVPLVPH